jgi:hypothetical protein
MLKSPSLMNEVPKAVERLQALLAEVPFITVEGVNHQSLAANLKREADFLLRVKAHGRAYQLICEVKSNGQPRYVRAAVDQLRYFVQPKQRDAYGVVIAPYLSPAAQEICRVNDAGFLDYEGNCRLVFDGVFIERAVPLKPSTERRELRSIFAPKSAQVLRLILRDPKRNWKVADLAREAGVSLGHTSNVRAGLIDREWARSEPEGLVVTDPDALLDNWREVYSPPRGQHLAFYTTLHGGALQQRLPQILKDANRNGHAILASFSAAQWLAPYARTNTQYLYADDKAAFVLRDGLALTSPARGENVMITQIKDRGLFRDAVEPAPHVSCTGPVQTYLDLYAAGERGREAAEHLRREKLKWRSK